MAENHNNTTYNKSQYLISYIRNRLKDVSKKIVDNDQILFDRLTFYQSFLLNQFSILRVDDNYPLYSGQVIDKNNIPVIPVDLHFLLCDCVLSEFTYVNKSFLPLDVLLKQIGVVCERLAVNNQTTENLSKKLIKMFRERLGDLSRVIVQNDSTVYERLTFYQNLILESYPILKVEVEFPLIPGLAVYPLDENISKVINIECSNVGLDYRFSDTTDDDRYFVIDNPDSITSDDILIFTCTLKSDSNDSINNNHYPIIPTKFYSLLVDCVLSEYSYVKPFMPLANVLQLISKMSSNLNVNNVRPKKFLRSIW